MSIGKKIEKLREEQDLTMTELAKKSKISVSYLNDIEKERKNPSVDTLQNIAQALGVKVSYLINSTDTSEEGLEEIEEQWPEAVEALRRGSKMSPEAKKKMVKLMQLFLDDEI